MSRYLSFLTNLTAIQYDPSYRNVKEKWIPEIRRHCPRAPIILVGTQVDRRGSQSHRQGEKVNVLTSQMGRKLAKEIKAHAYFETSAKENIGVTEALHGALEAAEEIEETRASCLCM